MWKRTLDEDNSSQNTYQFGIKYTTAQFTETKLLKILNLVADMSRPALMVLTPPADALAIQDDELTLPVTSPVVSSLFPFLPEDVSRSIEKQLVEAELLHAQSQPPLPDALIQADVSEESDSMLPLMPSLDRDAKQEDKKKNISQVTKYHPAGFHDPYSDDDDGLLDDDNGFLDL
jgi:hypothetical protein